MRPGPRLAPRTGYLAFSSPESARKRAFFFRGLWAIIVNACARRLGSRAGPRTGKRRKEGFAKKGRKGRAGGGGWGGGGGGVRGRVFEALPL